MKQHLRNFFVSFVIVCLGVASLDLVIDNPYTQNLLGIYLNKIIARETNLSITFESLNINVIPIEVNVFGVQISPTSDGNKGAKADAIQVKVRLSPVSILLGEPSISLLHIDGFNVRIPSNFDGSKLLKKHPETKKHNEVYYFPLKNISLVNAQILMDFSSETNPNSLLHVSGVGTKINFKDWNIFSGQFTIGSASFSSHGKEYFQETEIASNIRITRDIFSLENLSIKDQYIDVKSNLKGTLTLDTPNAQYLRVSGKTVIDGDLRFLEKLLDWKQTHGRAKIKSKVFLNVPFSKPSESSFSAEGFLEAFDGYLSGNRIYDSTSKFYVDNNSVTFKDTKIIIDKQEHAHFSGTIHLNDKVDFDFKGRVWDLPLSKIISSLGGKFEDVDFRTYSDNIKFGGTGEPFKMDLTGQAELANLDFPHIKVDRKKYTRTPNCYGNLNLSFTSKMLEFKDSDTYCFIPPEHYVPRPPRTKTFTPPPSAMYGSLVQLREYIDFDEGPHLSLVAKKLDLALAQTFLQTDIGGSTDVVSRIYESKHVLSITNVFSTNSFALNKVRYGDVKGTLNVLDHSIEWKNVTGGDGKFLLHSKTGSYDWKNDLLEFSAQSSNMSKELVKNTLSLLDQPALSKINFEVKNLNGTFKLPLKDMPNIELDFSTELAQVEYGGKEIFHDLKFSNRTKKSEFHFYDLGVHFGSIELGGTIKYKKKSFDKLFRQDDVIDASISTNPQNLAGNDIKDIPFLSDYLASMDLGGQVSLNWKIQGPLSHLGGFFDARLNKLSIRKYPIYPLNLKGFINHSNVQIYASQPGDNFLGRLDFNLDGEGIPFKWFFNLKQFDLRPFSPKLINADARNYAYLTAQWSWEGTLSKWWQSKGYLKFDDFNVAFFPPSDVIAEPVFMNSVRPATIRMTDKGWFFEKDGSFKVSGSGTEIDMRLAGSRPPKKLGLLINTSFNLASLSRIFPYVQSGSGILALESSIDGAIDDLKIKAHVFNKQDANSSKTPMTLSIQELNPVFQDIRVDLLYEDNVLHINELSARKGKGRFQIDGNFDLSEKSNSSSRVRLNMDQVSLDLNVPYLKTVHTILGGNIILSGSSRPFKVDGNLKIIRAQTERYLDIEGEIIKEYSAHRLGSSFQEETKPLFLFDLAIEANKSIEIMSKSFTSTLSSNASLKGTNDKPVLNGFVSVDKGKFRYKRDFTISRGELIFDNPLRNDPKLNVIASTQIGTYTVTIFISGESSKPLVDILVDPSTKDDGSVISRLDAIVLLSTGRLPATDSRSADASGVVVSTGLNLYAAQLPFDKFNDLTGQSFVSPYVNYTTDDQGNPVPQINVPIHISDLVEAIVQTIPNGRTSATVQVPLHDNISLSGSASSTQSTSNNTEESNQTQSGFDIMFAFPFK